MDANTEGFSKGNKLNKMGMKAQDTSELFFEDVHIPANALLGEENKGFVYLMTELPQERLLVAEMAIASAEASFEWTRTFLKERIAFGKPLTAKQTIQHRLATLKTEINTINDALGTVGKLRGVSYKWLKDGKPSIGVIAQEVEEVIPEVVHTTEYEGKNVKSVDYGKLVGVLIEAVKELKTQLDEHKAGGK